MSSEEVPGPPRPVVAFLSSAPLSLPGLAHTLMSAVHRPRTPGVPAEVGLGGWGRGRTEGGREGGREGERDKGREVGRKGWREEGRGEAGREAGMEGPNKHAHLSRISNTTRQLDENVL